MTQTRRNFLGETPEQRISRRRAALIEATLDLVAEGTLSELSVRKICARSRLSSRYFYESFSNLDELLGVILSTVATRVVERGLQANPGSNAEANRMILDAGLAALEEDPRQGKLLMLLASGDGHKGLAHHRQLIMDALAARAVERLRARNAPEEQIEVASTFAVAGLAELILAWLSGRVKLPRDEFVTLAATIAAASTAAVAPEV